MPTEADTTGGWYVYMVECADRSLYTGVARDVARRVAEHNEGRAAARYTRARRPVRLAWQEAAADRAAACRREAAIKRLTRAEKLRLIGETGDGHGTTRKPTEGFQDGTHGQE